MKKFLYSLIVFLFLISFTRQTKAVFVEGLEDIPIPEGLYQVENENLNFGNEEIRLIEATLYSKKLSFNDISAFYKETLPQMGWQIKEKNLTKIKFYRDGETLEISKESEKPTTIRLTVKSKLQ